MSKLICPICKKEIKTESTTWNGICENCGKNIPF